MNGILFLRCCLIQATLEQSLVKSHIEWPSYGSDFQKHKTIISFATESSNRKTTTKDCNDVYRFSMNQETAIVMPDLWAYMQ